MPILLLALRPLILKSFDRENVRTIAAVRVRRGLSAPQSKPLAGV